MIAFAAKSRECSGASESLPNASAAKDLTASGKCPHPAFPALNVSPAAQPDGTSCPSAT
jgi:hypothetical protein